MSHSFSTRVNQIYLPGDSVTLSKDDETAGKIILGPGLRKYGKEILVTKPGILRTSSSPVTYWIDCHHKRVNRRIQMAHPLECRSLAFLLIVCPSQR